MIAGEQTERRASDGNEAVARAADVLLRFLDGSSRDHGVTEIAVALGLSKTVVHRILRSLCGRGLLSATDRGRYRLGASSAALGARALREIELRTAALPYLRRLQNETRETSTISALVGYRRVYLDQVPGPQEITMTVELGRAYALTVGAPSRALLAFAPVDVRTYVATHPLAKLTPSSIVDRPTLHRELERVRAEGTAVSFNERGTNTAAIAAPIFGVDGHAIGSLGICGPLDRFDEPMVARNREIVRRAAEAVSRELGWETRRA